MNENQTIWLSCGVLQAELETLHQQKKIKGELLFLDSMLHMKPQQLEDKLVHYLNQYSKTKNNLILVYGDCCPRMLNLIKQFQVRRVKAINCAQLLAGRELYRKLMENEAFLLIPEWAFRWKEIMMQELGLTDIIAPVFMREHRKELVYLDTGLIPIPTEILSKCSAFSGLPWRIEKVGLDHLLLQLLEAQTSKDR